MQVIKPFKVNKLAEIMQQKQTQMAMARKDGKDAVVQLHQYVLCRDFFNEVMQSNVDGKRYAIYGFEYHKDKDNALPQDYIGFMYYMPKAADEEAFLKNLVLLNAIEDYNGLELTTVEKICPREYYIQGDKFWLGANYLVSLYSFLLRVFSYNLNNTKEDDWIQEASELKTNEGSYLTQVSVPKFKHVLRNLKKLPVNTASPGGWGTDPNVSSLHNNSGFVSIFTGNNSTSYKDRIAKFMQGVK